MTRRQKNPLRGITSEERQELERISRATSESVSRVTRAQVLLAVAKGVSYAAAAEACGRRSGDAVAQLVERFNREGLGALTPKHGGGARTQYTAEQRQQILAVAQQQPELETDGVSQWSLVTLQRRLRASGGAEFATVSTYTIGQVLHEAGYSWQNSRSWCRTGSALRRRKSGVVTVVDPDAEVKKT
ncbi:MAG: helix-turn-helix domain containing protein [Oscillatoriales cyanobacterium C42_A2020_001]|nr:helix-turn-helix domain containing protein [Leptolyngbyaceae cyanobacterium C42_A2020_001]